MTEFFSEGWYNGDVGTGYTWPTSHAFAPGCTLGCGQCAVTVGRPSCSRSSIHELNLAGRCGAITLFSSWSNSHYKRSSGCVSDSDQLC